MIFAGYFLFSAQTFVVRILLITACFRTNESDTAMKTTYCAVVITFAAVLLSSPVALAGSDATPAPVAVSKPAAKHSSSGSSKSALRKSRHYSPATLSAFRPYVANAPAASAEPASAFINTAPAADLRAPPQLAETVEKSSVFNVESNRGAVLVDEDDHTAFEQAASSTNSNDPASFGGDTLGSESVSVIDRIADKPKAKAIASGPLRVRVNDRALRASVQIPLSDR